MSRENLDFTNFKLLFLKAIFYGLSSSAKMAKVEGLGFRSYLDSFHQITSHQRAKTSYLEGIWPHLAADFAETSYPYEIVCVKVGKALQFPSIFWAQVGR
jgi:hypothetical protein